MCLVQAVEVVAVLWQPPGYQLGILISAEQSAAVGRILECPASYCAARNKCKIYIKLHTSVLAFIS